MLHILAIVAISGRFSSFARAQAKNESASGQRKALAIYAPRPQYPYEARNNHLTGSCVASLNVDLRDGYVTSAQMLKSTGYQILDEAALNAYRQWRFKPGTVRKVRVPITFTMRGVSY